MTKRILLAVLLAAVLLGGCKFPALPEIDVDAAPTDGGGADGADDDAGLDGPTVDAPPPCARRVTFTDTTDVEVFVANIDGTGILNVSLSGFADQRPRWSPTSNVIVFASTRTGSTREIFAVNANGTGLTNLTNNTVDDFNPMWSPDGTKIAFSRRSTGAPTLWVMDANGANARELSTVPTFDPAGWSPTSDRLVFYSSSDADCYVVGVAGGGATSITTWTTDRCKTPQWSPDGTRIAFITQPDFGMAELMTVAPDGTGPINVSQTPGANERGPSWGPGGALAFSSDRNGKFEIFTSASSTAITSSPASAMVDGDLDPVWSPSGNKVLFVRQIGTSSKLGVMNLDGTGLVVFSANANEDVVDPGWSSCQ